MFRSLMTTTRFSFSVLQCCKSLGFNFHKVSVPCGTHSFMRYLNTEKLNEETDVSVRDKIHLSLPSITKWKRPPFVKNLFLGKLDTELLAFPEILDTEHLAEVEKNVLALNTLYKEKVNSFKIDEERKIPKDVLQEFKDIGLFGRLAPAKYGGLDLTYTAYTRLNEAIGLDWSIGTVLGVHELMGIQALLAVGSDAQKEKYLADLASGKKVATFCNYEMKSGCDPTSVETTAMLTPDGSTYMLNGVKSWVTNADGADLYLVMAKVQKSSLISQDDETILLLVNRDMDGVIPSATSDNVCLRGINVGIVKFKDVVVPTENVLGQPGLGHSILNRLHESCRFGLGSLSLGTLKSFCDNVTEYVIDAERNAYGEQKTLADFLIIRKRLSRIAQRLYAMESISYFTAAIYDSTENPDCALESAIVKVFNSEGTLFCLQELIKVVGAMGLSKSRQLERFYRDAQGLAMLESPNDIVRLFIGLSGCQFVGEIRAKEIEKYRNPFFFPMSKLRNINKYSRIEKGKFKYNQDLAGHLHPSLTIQGNALEECVQRLDAAMDGVLTIHGRDVMETQLDPTRLADMAIDIYSMAAVLSRASRSYCIGLRNNDHELTLAAAYCYGTVDRVQETYKEIAKGVFMNNDGSALAVGEQIIDCRGYFPEHPLKHNL